MRKIKLSFRLLAGLCLFTLTATAVSKHSLSELFSIQKVEAKCCDTSMNNGKCNWEKTRCVPRTGNDDINCDVTRTECSIEQT